MVIVIGLNYKSLYVVSKLIQLEIHNVDLIYKLLTGVKFR
jgi:hypothetical protein